MPPSHRRPPSRRRRAGRRSTGRSGPPVAGTARGRHRRAVGRVQPVGGTPSLDVSAAIGPGPADRREDAGSRDDAARRDGQRDVAGFVAGARSPGERGGSREHDDRVDQERRMRQATAREEHGRSPPRPAGSGEARRGREERDGDHEVGQIPGNEMDGEDAREEPGEEPRLAPRRGQRVGPAPPTPLPPRPRVRMPARPSPPSRSDGGCRPARRPRRVRPAWHPPRRVPRSAPTRVHQR